MELSSLFHTGLRRSGIAGTLSMQRAARGIITASGLVTTMCSEVATLTSAGSAGCTISMAAVKPVRVRNCVADEQPQVRRDGEQEHTGCGDAKTPGRSPGNVPHGREGQYGAKDAGVRDQGTVSVVERRELGRDRYCHAVTSVPAPEEGG